MWATIKSVAGAVAGAINVANWFTKKRDQADQQEAGAAKQRAKNADETIGAVGDAKAANGRMRDPGGKRARRVRKQFSRD